MGLRSTKQTEVDIDLGWFAPVRAAREFLAAKTQLQKQLGIPPLCNPRRHSSCDELIDREDGWSAPFHL